MKISTMNWVGITTMLLLILVIMSTLNAPYPWVFGLTIGGQVVLIYMVYRVLSDNYRTRKTFSNGYEDRQLEDLE